MENKIIYLKKCAIHFSTLKVMYTCKEKCCVLCDNLIKCHDTPGIGLCGLNMCPNIENQLMDLDKLDIMLIKNGRLQLKLRKGDLKALRRKGAGRRKVDD